MTPTMKTLHTPFRPSLGWLPAAGIALSLLLFAAAVLAQQRLYVEAHICITARAMPAA